MNQVTPHCVSRLRDLVRQISICTIVQKYIMYFCTVIFFWKAIFFQRFNSQGPPTSLSHRTGIAEGFGKQLYPIVFKLRIRETVMGGWLTRWW